MESSTYSHIDIKKFIGVISPMAFETLWYPKRLLLMFDELVVDLNSKLSGYESYVINQSRNEIEWLADNGLLTVLSGLIAISNKPNLNKKQISISGDNILPKELGKSLNKYTESTLSAEMGSPHLREIASDLRSLRGLDAVVVSPPDKFQNVDSTVTRDSVVRISLSEFPMPSDSTSWENIIEFRKNEKHKIQFQHLKVWMNKMGKSGLTEYEVTDVLRDIIYTYKHELELSKMKVQRGTLEVILTTTAEVAENLLKLNVATAMKSIFQVNKEYLKLIEEEKKLDGREIAYLVSAQRRFSDKY